MTIQRERERDKRIHWWLKPGVQSIGQIGKRLTRSASCQLTPMILTRRAPCHLTPMIKCQLFWKLDENELNVNYCQSFVHPAFSSKELCRIYDIKNFWSWRLTPKAILAIRLISKRYGWVLFVLNSEILLCAWEHKNLLDFFPHPPLGLGRTEHKAIFEELSKKHWDLKREEQTM